MAGVAHQTKSLSGYTHSRWHGNAQISPQGGNSLFLMQHYGACVDFWWRVLRKSLGMFSGPWWPTDPSRDSTAVWPCFLQLCSCVLWWKRGRWHQKGISPPPQDLFSYQPFSFLKTPHSQLSWMQSTKEQQREWLGCHTAVAEEDKHTWFAVTFDGIHLMA